jgi:hypothetical protein
VGIKELEPGPFAGHLQAGERVVWADRPSLPQALRRLGFPPRSSAHILGWGVALTGLSGLALAAVAHPGLSATTRLALLAAGAAPAVAVGAVMAWGLRRRARTQYALTSAGRALLREGSHVRAVDAAGARVTCEPNLAFGVLEVGGLRFVDLAYPAALEPILEGITAAREP